MALYIPHSIFHLARLLYDRAETFGPYYVVLKLVENSTKNNIIPRYHFNLKLVCNSLECLIQSVRLQRLKSRLTDTEHLPSASELAPQVSVLQFSMVHKTRVVWG